MRTVGRVRSVADHGDAFVAPRPRGLLVKDKNNNSVVCRKQTEDFGLAVVDDNDA